MDIPDVSVIGTGALGSVLAAALHKPYGLVKSIYNRSSSKSRELAEKLDIPLSGTFPAAAGELGDLIFITVPDDSIAGVAEKLSELSDSWSGYSVVHCSGSETSSILRTLKDKGARTAAFHPLQTFTRTSTPLSFRDIYFSMEGDSELLDLLGEVAGLLRARTLKITPGAKSYLHAAAVMASNYFIALLHASDQIAELGGMDIQQARKALLPLVRQSMENAGEGDLAGVLSGPVARGDTGTVNRHLELLETDTDLLTLYKQLGKQAIKLAKRNGALNSRQITELERLFTTG